MSALKKQLRRLFYKMTSGGKPEYHCPICGYRGIFKDKKLYMSREVRVSTKCLGCNSKERHRMMHLLFEEFFPIREAIDTYGQMRTRLRFFAVIGRQAAWVSEHSLGSMTSKGGRLSSSPAWRGLRRHRWFHETVDWIKLTRLRHMMLARLLKAEYFIDPSRRWSAMPSGRPVIFGD